MKKPTLSDFNLTEDSLRIQKRRRSLWKFIIIPISAAVGLANDYFWLQMDSVIGDWSILGLVLTFFGVLPFIYSKRVLEWLVGRCFYPRLAGFERAQKRYEEWFVRTQLSFWDSLSGTAFEHEVADLLNRAGCGAHVTPASNYMGVDVILEDGTLVQCKAHKSKVSPAVARELYGKLRHIKTHRAILISKNGFTKGVFEFARGKPLLLWDVTYLMEIQKQLDN